jgi:hypothetical protein
MREYFLSFQHLYSMLTALNEYSTTVQQNNVTTPDYKIKVSVAAQLSTNTSTDSSREEHLIYLVLWLADI